MKEQIVHGKPLSPRVTAVSPEKDYMLRLVFSNGEHRVFDAKPLLKMEVFARLRNPVFFDSVRVAYGSIAWPNDLDYCPDTLYLESTAAAD